jgi:hypothetical protein
MTQSRRDISQREVQQLSKVLNLSYDELQGLLASNQVQQTEQEIDGYARVASLPRDSARKDYKP